MKTLNLEFCIVLDKTVVVPTCEMAAPVCNVVTDTAVNDVLLNEFDKYGRRYPVPEVKQDHESFVLYYDVREQMKCAGTLPHNE